MQVESFLESSAASLPGKTALIAGGREYTYREVETAANRLARSLMREGVKRGDRVAIQLENSYEAVVSVFAILKAGAVFLVVHPTTKSDKLLYILNNCRASGLITEAAKAASPAITGESAPSLRALWVVGQPPAANGLRTVDWNAVAGDAAAPSGPPPKQCIDIDLAALIYTSGSTGRPKGVMLTHLNMVSAATSITTYLENTERDIILNLLPLSFDYGLYQVLMAFKVGATVVLERSFPYLFSVIESLKRYNVTGFPIVPTISALLLQLDLAQHRFPALRYITNTAAALPIEHIRRLRDLFPGVALYSMYGLTECKRVSYLPPDQIDIRPGSVGRGMPNEEVYLVNDKGERLPTGSTGELVVRGSNVMKGYWELPAETARMLKPGPLPNEMALYTGDLFRTDAEGYLYFVGRKDDIIKSRGEKVSPREVEDVLYAIDGVAEAAVFGVPDAVLGEAITAVVRLSDGAQLTAEDILRQCTAKLESFMVPKFVRFCDAMPKTSSGKIDKRALAARGEMVHA